MNYQKVYNQLCERAKREKRKKSNKVYYEAHHIVPKSEGGPDTKDNIVLLTAREHYIAHWLLYRIEPLPSRVYAFYAMSQQSNSLQERYTPSSRTYQEAKEGYTKLRMRGKNVKCDTCGKVFYIAEKLLKQFEVRYCSMKCTRKGKYMSCAGCGKKIYVMKHRMEKSKTGKFTCSYECEWSIRKDDSNTKKCLHCGEAFHHSTKKYCNRECYVASKQRS